MMPRYMIFTSMSFLAFCVLVCIAFVLVRKSAYKRAVLLIASCIFYGAWDYRFLALLLATALVNFFAAKAISVSDKAGTKKRWFVGALIFDIGVLAGFKYLGFFAQSAHDLFALFGFSIGTLETKILLPVGISFYIFQAIAYTVDIYRGTRKPTHSFFNFSLFLSFFPQLLQGPIERGDLIEKIRAIPDGHKLGWAGVQLILRGMFKKVGWADNFAALADPIFSSQDTVSSPGMWLAMYLYTFQIYFDFSGYTDIARGLGRLFGVELSENFRSPYSAQSPRDFWNRWHMTLSNWLRDYLYIPLGGNRCSQLRQSFNLMLTMLLAGLWHGAAWTFVIWGGYHGVLLTINHYLRKAFPKLPDAMWFRMTMRIVTFHLVAFGWVMFRCDGLDAAWRSYVSLSQIFDFDQWRGAWILFAAHRLPVELVLWVSLMLGGFVMSQVYRENTDQIIEKHFTNRPYRRILIATLLLVLTVIFAPEKAPEFLYFQF